MLRQTLIGFLLLVATSASAEPTPLRNPVLPGFHPDPSVTRVGEDYFLVTSSFQFFPAVPLFHSRDLVHWRAVGHVLDRPAQVDLSRLTAFGGIYAPTLRYHQGTYYMITANVAENGGVFYVHTRDLASGWSDPVFVRRGGIDPDLFFDDDGTVYLTSTAPSGDVPRGIYQSRLDLATGKERDEPRLIWRGVSGKYPEGPHLYRKDGWYYLVISEGGTEAPTRRRTGR